MLFPFLFYVRHQRPLTTHSPFQDIITNLLQEHTIHQLDTHGCAPCMFYEATFCHNHDCNCNIYQCLYHMLVQGDGTLCFFCSLDQLLKRNYIITVVHSVTSALFMKKFQKNTRSDIKIFKYSSIQALKYSSP